MREKFSLYGKNLNAVSLTLTNSTNREMTNIQVLNAKLSKGQEMRLPDTIAVLGGRESVEVRLHVGFNGSSDPVCFTVSADSVNRDVKLKSEAGELLRPAFLSQQEFEQQQKKMGGLNENSLAARVKDKALVAQAVLDIANVAALSHGDNDLKFRFAGERLHDDSILLVELMLNADDDACRVTINCADFMFNGHIASLLKKALSA